MLINSISLCDPFATIWASYYSIISSGLYFNMNINLQPISVFLFSNFITLQVLFFSTILTSFMIAFLHCVILKSSWTSLGISVLSWLEVKEWNPIDRILDEINLEKGWRVQDRVCFLKIIGNSNDLRGSELPSFEIDS